MSEKPQPPLPVDDDEARFDDEGSAIGHPQPAEPKEPKQKPKKGATVPGPERRAAGTAKFLEVLLCRLERLLRREVV
jgi:hypothetical protein